MDSCSFFEKNILALSGRNPKLCSALKATKPKTGMYVFKETASGDKIPAIVDCMRGVHTPPSCGVKSGMYPQTEGLGFARPLHSTVNPKREAQRLVSAVGSGAVPPGFFVFLGLGAGFAPAAALELSSTSGVLVIDYDLESIATLFCRIDYSSILGDSRFTLFIDPAPGVIESSILELYQPVLSGGISVLPLAARTAADKTAFAIAGEALRSGIEKVSADYSVQAHFGKQWFANIVRNIIGMENAGSFSSIKIPAVHNVAICAAGPSLDMQIPLLLEEKNNGSFVISTDTALPALLHHGLKPDAVVAIDCQHIGYHHFVGTDCRDIPLFMDIAGPSVLRDFCDNVFFFSGGHPFATYLCKKWLALPVLDTSGGNVTFACLSLAESLGAKRIAVYAADFSYPAGKIYARGTYVFPYFERRQNRLSTLEGQVSGFLFRSPFLPAPCQADGVSGSIRRYETATMHSYRTSFMQKASGIKAEVLLMPGLGSKITTVIEKGICDASGDPGLRFGVLEKPKTSATEFLEKYICDITALPTMPAGSSGMAYLQNLEGEAKQVFTTLLPQMAAFKHRRPELPLSELLETAKHYCCQEMEKVINPFGFS